VSLNNHEVLALQRRLMRAAIEMEARSKKECCNSQKSIQERFGLSELERGMGAYAHHAGKHIMYYV